ncbi:MAG: hypothetical protein ABR956_18545 [Terracidiphilus sp.]|jgi:hypothetical protein
MYNRLDSSRRILPVILGVVTLIDVVALFVWDVFPGLFPARSHDFLAAFSLALIAVAYLVYQALHRPAAAELVKAAMLAAAFLFWAANQFWPNLPQATLFNDVAIALFVLDVFLVMIGWPATSADGAFAESPAETTPVKAALSAPERNRTNCGLS